jgi:general secretion pathway protein D
MGRKWAQIFLRLALVGMLASCAAQPKGTKDSPGAAYSGASTYGLADPASTSPTAGSAFGGSSYSGRATRRSPLVRMGSGKFVSGTLGASPDAAATPGDVTLNFESADLREVVKTIFEDILQENYELDPNVRGVVTMHTTMPVSRDSVLPILEGILQSNGAALVRGQDLYKVVPVGSVKPALAAPSIGRTAAGGRAGYGVQIVPLRYVAAAEMKKILDPFTMEPTRVEIDETRNVVLLSGPRMNVNNLIETIKIFDVDWFEGMSFALFPVEYADVEQLSEEITEVLDVGDQGALSRIVKFIPVERLNALLVVTHQPKHLKLVADLVEHFDRGTRAGPERRLFVYNLRYAEAAEIADTLQDIFSEAEGEAGSRDGPRARRGAGRPPGAELGADTAAQGETARASLRSRDAGTENSGPVSIKADTKNNALIVLASPADYRAVEAAIAKLDVPARQVLIEATIAEVQLTDNMSYGIRWFFEWGIGGYGLDVGFGAPLPQSVGGQGLSMAIFNSAGEVRTFFDILGAETSVRFLSAPQVVVVDNETANFRVGDQIPVVTRASQSTTSPDAPVVSEVEYRDTGTLLSVKPRINAGGVVTLEISQEVSNPGPAAAGANPPIAQRTITSTVVVQTGQTVVLGGLIRENKSKSKSGIPGLMDVPVVGGLFRNTTDDRSRSELIITVTPRVIKNPYEYRLATEDLRRRVKRATAVEQSVRR